MAFGPAGAQSLGTFAWQLQPFCNVVVVNVVQAGAVFTLDESDPSESRRVIDPRRNL